MLLLIKIGTHFILPNHETNQIIKSDCRMSKCKCNNEYCWCCYVTKGITQAEPLTSAPFGTSYLWHNLCYLLCQKQQKQY